jgi:hypothetical protein
MFGFGRARARKAALAATNGLVHELRDRAGIPPGFWDDAYALGYLFTVAEHATNLILGSNISEVTRTEIALDALGEASGQGAKIRRRAASLIAQKHPHWLDGAHAANRVTCVAAGQTRYDSDATVVAARSAAASLNGLIAPEPGNPTNSEVAEILEMLLFKDAILDRLSASASPRTRFVRSWPGSQRRRTRKA